MCTNFRKSLKSKCISNHLIYWYVKSERSEEKKWKIIKNGCTIFASFVSTQRNIILLSAHLSIFSKTKKSSYI